MPTWVRAKVESKLFGDEVRVHAVRGREGISRLYEFDVDVFAAKSSGLAGNDVIGSEIDLILLSEDGTELRRVHGIVAELLDDLDAHDAPGCRLHVVPRFWAATLAERIDIFMDVSIPDLIRQKLVGMTFGEGRDFEFRLVGQYFPREFIVQYMETDLAFLSRLTEHFGISFFFEQREGVDVLVFADSNNGFTQLDGSATMTSRGEHQDVFQLRSRTRMVPSQFIQRDYNYRNPSANLFASVQIPDGAGGGVIEYGSHFKTKEEGTWIAGLRAEERRATRHVFDGESILPRISAGSLLAIDGHPSGDLKLVVTEVEHELKQADTTSTGHNTYKNRFYAISKAVAFRPLRRTPKPRVHGVLTAMIDAEQNGPYAEIDNDGRYRVRFLFDTGDPKGGQASRVCRMMQPHSGPGYGMHFPLRLGTEVLITFVNGDPDRPIISGTVPNPQTPSPVKAENASRNIIRTGGGNEVNMDDTEGSHRIKMTTPHKNTVFQLGAPNAPEAGAILTTEGAWSTMATTGTSNLTTFNTAKTAFSKFSEGANVDSNAAAPQPLTGWNFASSVVGVIDALAAECDALLATVQQGYVIAQKTADSNNQEAQDKLDQATNDLDKAQNAQAAALAALIAAAPPGSQLATDLAAPVPPATATPMSDYQAAVAKLASDQKTLASDTKSRDLAKRKGLTDEGTLLDATVAADQAKVTKDLQTLQTKQTALEAALTADLAGPFTPPLTPDQLAALTAAVNAYNADTTSVDALQTPMNDAANAQLVTQKGLDDATYDTSTTAAGSDTAQDLGYARAALAAVKFGDATFNALMTTFGLLKTALHKLDKAALLTKAMASYTPIAPEAAKLFSDAGLTPALATTFGNPKTVSNTVRSEGVTTIAAQTAALLYSPQFIVTALSVDANPTATPPAAKVPGNLLMMADDLALLISKDKAELNGNNLTYVASNTAVKIVATNNLVPATRATMDLTSTDVMHLLSNKSMKIEVDTSKNGPLPTTDKNGLIELTTVADQSIKLDQSAKKTTIQAFEQFELDATKVAQILAGTDKVSLKMDADAAKFTASVTNDWKLDIDGNSGVNLGKDSSKLTLAAAAVTLDGGSKSTATVQGSSVALKASGNIQLKGSKVLIG